MRTHYCTQMSGLHDWINILSSIANPNLKLIVIDQKSYIEGGGDNVMS